MFAALDFNECAFLALAQNEGDLRLNFDLFMALPRPTARITHAAKLEFPSKNRFENREAGQSKSSNGMQPWVNETVLVATLSAASRLFYYAPRTIDDAPRAASWRRQIVS